MNAVNVYKDELFTAGFEDLPYDWSKPSPVWQMGFHAREDSKTQHLDRVFIVDLGDDSDVLSMGEYVRLRVTGAQPFVITGTVERVTFGVVVMRISKFEYEEAITL